MQGKRARVAENATREFLESSWASVLERYFDLPERVFEFETPEALKKLVDFSLPDEAKRDASTWPEIESLIDRVIAHSPHAQHPGFLNYLYATPDPVGLLADWLISLINSNVHTYEASPVFALAELEVVARLGKLVGYDERSGGVFCPGGSYSNMLAMHAARTRLRQRVDARQDQLAVLTSAQSHYSVSRAASLLGIDRELVVEVPCDERGRMQSDALAVAMQRLEDEGRHPFFVCATSGTTVLGAFDPLDEIADVLRAHPDTWLHVDAAWGGAVLMHPAYRSRMAGIERADSLTWDFHKALGAPIFCSALVAKEGACLEDPFGGDGDYLFHEDDSDQQYNLGQRTAQCGRRADAFKLWLMWKVHGSNGLAERVGRAFETTRTAVEAIRGRDAFLLDCDAPEYLNVAFWYLPKSERPCTDVSALRDPEAVSRLTRKLYEALKRDGRVMVNIAEVPGRPAFVRLITANPYADRASLSAMLDIVESLGDMLSQSLEELLVSGGDERLDLDEEGVNYTFSSPHPRPEQVARSSCTSSTVTVEQQERAGHLLDDLREACVSFDDCMTSVHDRIRSILSLEDEVSIVTTPSGTDAEFIPLAVARAIGGRGTPVVNIMTGVGEIGTNSVTAAEGRFFKKTTPCGSSVEAGTRLRGFEDVRVVEVTQRDDETGRPTAQTEVWSEHVERSLEDPDTIVLLHVLESSKLGYRLEELEKIDELLTTHRERLCVVVDACQSRTDISRIRIYLKLGCMVMMTGSKFEEGPPFSGAVVIPPSLSQRADTTVLANCTRDLGRFITRHDVSGPLAHFRGTLSERMNWGLMLRWTLALDHWQAYRAIEDSARTGMIGQWVRGVLECVDAEPSVHAFGGGEEQPGSVGDTNTIISVELENQGRKLSAVELRSVYRWMTQDMSGVLSNSEVRTPGDAAVLSRPFLMGQPVDLGNVAVLRIALGARTVIEMAQQGATNVLGDDRALVTKLSWLAGHFDLLAARDAAANE